MTQTLTAPQTADEEETSGITLALPSGQPVTDIEAFLASVPKFMDEEVKALEEAIIGDRAERRATAGVTR
jgi:hypothetical protein